MDKIKEIEINNNLSVKEEGIGIRIKSKDTDIFINYGRDLENLIFAMMYLHNSFSYGLPNNEIELNGLVDRGTKCL